MIIKKYIISIILAVYLMLFFSETAYAYIDPATGSYLFQILLAGLLGAMFAVKMFWKSIKNFTVNLFSKNKNSDLDE